jgi:sugar phosphate isomerase/epimerase
MTSRLSRRAFLGATAGLGLAAHSAFAQNRPIKMTMNLSCGRIGVSAGQEEAIALAKAHGFQSVDPNPGYLAKMDDSALAALRDRMKQDGITWAAGDAPVDFRNDDASFREGMKGLPAVVESLERAGVDRVGTWLMFGSNELTYREYGVLMTRRLREMADVFGDHGLRFGLEYVGTWSAWTSVQFPWVHTMAETLELIENIGRANVGLVLDSWHWYHALESVEDITALTNDQVVVVDLNDGTAGLDRKAMQDTTRELPAATGVINVGAFLTALADIGYDGPVRAEPFSKTLNAMENEKAVAATAVAMKKAFALIES